MGITYADKPKQPYEEIPDYIDFVNRLPAGETIVSSTVKCYDATGVDTTATMIKAASGSGTKVYFTYLAGADGGTYNVEVRVVSATAKVEEDLVIEVKEL